MPGADGTAAGALGGRAVGLLVVGLLVGLPPNFRACLWPASGWEGCLRSGKFGLGSRLGVFASSAVDIEASAVNEGWKSSELCKRIAAGGVYLARVVSILVETWLGASRK